MNNIIAFLQKVFQPRKSGILLPLNKMSYFLVKCAKSHTYIETLGDHADSLHLWVKNSYEQDFRQAFELQVRKAIKHLCISSVKLVFDTTDEPFYGDTRGLHIFNVKGEKFDGVFKFITVCITARNKQIPLMALPVRVGEGFAELTIQLLEYCKTLFNRIRSVVFDRGFYICQLIDYLEGNHIKYLIPVPEKKGKITEYVHSTETFGKYNHEMKYSKEKSCWKPRTTIVVCKGIDDWAWIFATNIKFNTRCEYIWYYKRRWQIETNYRVEDEARIKSKSTHHLIRYFYFLISLLLHILWIVNKNVNYHTPFKKYIDIIEHTMLSDYLGIPDV